MKSQTNGIGFCLDSESSPSSANHNNTSLTSYVPMKRFLPSASTPFIAATDPRLQTYGRDSLPPPPPFSLASPFGSAYYSALYSNAMAARPAAATSQTLAASIFSPANFASPAAPNQHPNTAAYWNPSLFLYQQMFNQ